MREHEHSIAVAFVCWWAYYSRSLSIDHRVLFAIPNGGHRNPRTGGRLKKEGVRAGVPDYFLAVSRGGFNGLFIELKSPVGTMRRNQIEMFDVLSKQNYNCVCAKSAEDAITSVTAYLCLQ